MKIINVILSGGVGSRLWPLSRKSKPKQYLGIFQGQSLFQKTAARNASFCDEIIIVGNKNNYELSRKDLSSAGLTKYREIIEAMPRNTAAAIAFAAFDTQAEDILLVTPSDHLIEDQENYASCIERAITLAKEGNIVTFGLVPTKPETGFGYIEFEKETVISFREKPDTETAKEFVSSGRFLWNSGMFCFGAGVFLEELKNFEPEVYEKSWLAYQGMQDGFLPTEESAAIPSISVDYAVMERSRKIKVVSSAFQWSDMGSFESIYDYFQLQGYPVDEEGNMTIGTDLFTAFVGLKNCMFIQTEDAHLILQKEAAQDVKKIYERLEKENNSLT
ncbi:mannose-1-phosphate guanylyltransferase [Mongoliitalea daihaiensis]|uniref:mannose-1-phosphate guanylyltransferase n=1 Tax=Mongoliitalea daihaiensis TaxID=2782006 RepID=UPI001F32DFF4|nr:sugar phosphate nucleotidyltransferase [Mongoliitalea daihaiensis]UJP64524.1 mannose-1-phosphate guanylyltransferase [Mongoliitalea daihaiensis]